MRYVSHGIWATNNEKVRSILFYIFRVTLEWLFVINLRGFIFHKESHQQVEQLVVYFMTRYIEIITKEDGGIRPYIEIEGERM